MTTEAPLLRVQHAKLTFLVDNSIEWYVFEAKGGYDISFSLTIDSRMSPLPLGFKSEMKRHISEGPPVDNLVTHTPILDLEHYCCGQSLPVAVSNFRSSI